MKTYKYEQREVTTNLHEELDDWCYESHMWTNDVIHAEGVTLQCIWCGRKIYNALIPSSFRNKLCPKNPVVKKLLEND